MVCGASPHGRRWLVQRISRCPQQSGPQSRASPGGRRDAKVSRRNPSTSLWAASELSSAVSRARADGGRIAHSPHGPPCIPPNPADRSKRAEYRNVLPLLSRLSPPSATKTRAAGRTTEARRARGVDATRSSRRPPTIHAEIELYLDAYFFLLILQFGRTLFTASLLTFVRPNSIFPNVVNPRKCCIPLSVTFV